jgi:transcriptional regulator with XRE-family HTH domain
VKPSDRFQRLLHDLEQDPDFDAEGLLIEVTEQIVHRLDKRGMSQAELAKALRVSGPYVSKLLSGGENLTLRQLHRVAVALGCQLKVELAPAAQPHRHPVQRTRRSVAI